MVKHTTTFLLELQSKWIFLIWLAGKHLKSVKKSVEFDLLECNCSIDIDHFNILAFSSNKFSLIKKSLMIKRDQP